MNRTIHAASAEKRTVRGVDDRVDRLLRDVALGEVRFRPDGVQEGLQLVDEGRCDGRQGEAGIGKTALMQELGREARIQGFRWVDVRLSPLEGLRRPLAQALDLLDRHGLEEPDARSSPFPIPPSAFMTSRMRGTASRYAR